MPTSQRPQRHWGAGLRRPFRLPHFHQACPRIPPRSGELVRDRINPPPHLFRAPWANEKTVGRQRLGFPWSGQRPPRKTGIASNHAIAGVRGTSADLGGSGAGLSQSAARVTVKQGLEGDSDYLCTCLPYWERRASAVERDCLLPSFLLSEGGYLSPQAQMTLTTSHRRSCGPGLRRSFCACLARYLFASIGKVAPCKIKAHYAVLGVCSETTRVRKRDAR